MCLLSADRKRKLGREWGYAVDTSVDSADEPAGGGDGGAGSGSALGEGTASGAASPKWWVVQSDEATWRASAQVSV